MGLGKLGLAADQISPIDKLHAHRPAPRFTPPEGRQLLGRDGGRSSPPRSSRNSNIITCGRTDTPAASIECTFRYKAETSLCAGECHAKPDAIRAHRRVVARQPIS
jgi:hypothetical protein